MPGVFISYAREDQPFVHQRNAWVDREGIRPTAQWLAAISTAIDAGDTFVFVMAPDALASELCVLQLQHGASPNKRLCHWSAARPLGTWCPMRWPA